MDKQFIASEVRDYIRRYPLPEKVKDMLTTFADLLEAQEKAAPVATVRWHPKHGFNWRDVGSGPHGDLHTGWIDVPLYTHPAPADAERLAEALRKIVDIDYVKRCCNNGIEVHYPDAPPEMECCGDPDVDFGPFAQIAMDALAAHSAQAQKGVE